jgi:hypothetical protein
MASEALLALGKKWMTSRPFSITGRSTVTPSLGSRPLGARDLRAAGSESVSFWNTADFLASRADSAPLKIQASGWLECNTVDTLDSLLLPDVMLMAVRAAYIIQHQTLREFPNFPGEKI